MNPPYSYPDRQLVLSLMFSFAVFLCLLPHSLIFCDMTSPTSYVGRAVNAAVCSSWADIGWGGAYTEEEDGGTSKFPAQSCCCLVLCILCYTVVSLSQDCTLLFR